jgi:predicted AlkP superfamily pyrophosphatase or phosphodiesterase
VGAQATGSGGTNRPEHRDKPYLILVSLDGFKAEYFDRFELPNLRRIARRGTRAKSMVPVFPSLTFPNHYSLVTGLHPGRHGIVSNRFYDPERKQAYAYTELALVSDGSWYRGEPIWVTAEKQGMVSACFFWPGSEAAIGGVRATIWNRYDGAISNAARVRTVIDWLRLPPERRPHMITLYFSELDTASHDAFDTPAVNAAALSLDRAIGQLLDGIDALPIRERIHLLVTSDHGMVNTSPAQSIPLADLLDKTALAEVVRSFGGPVASLHVRGGGPAAVMVRNQINAKLARGTAYLREELPDRYHYRDDPRAGDVVVVMDESWTLNIPRAPSITPAATSKPPAPAAQPASGEEETGQHGWDNAFPSMRAFFLAMGPGIREGALVGEVENVDVYPLMAELLGIRPATDLDGRTGVIHDLIRK